MKLRKLLKKATKHPYLLAGAAAAAAWYFWKGGSVGVPSLVTQSAGATAPKKPRPRPYTWMPQTLPAKLEGLGAEPRGGGPFIVQKLY